MHNTSAGNPAWPKSDCIWLGLAGPLVRVSSFSAEAAAQALTLTQRGR